MIGQVLKFWPPFEGMAPGTDRVMGPSKKVRSAETPDGAGRDGGRYLMTYMPVYS